VSARRKPATTSKHASLVQRVHVAASWLKLDDATYRAAIAAHAGGKTSSKACGVRELEALLEHFHRCGFPRPGGKRFAPLTPRQKKMYALWQQLADGGHVEDRSMDALDAWIQRQTNTRRQWLNGAQEDQLIESLKKWSER
jgi:phage gp16-like protein